MLHEVTNFFKFRTQKKKKKAVENEKFSMDFSKAW